jgi:hypothetical protein
MGRPQGAGQTEYAPYRADAPCEAVQPSTMFCGDRTFSGTMSTGRELVSKQVGVHRAGQEQWLPGDPLCMKLVLKDAREPGQGAGKSGAEHACTKA